MVEKTLDFDPIYEAAVDGDGTLNLPENLLRQAGFFPGDGVKIVMLNGEIKLRPARLMIPEITADVMRMMAEDGVTSEDLLSGLDDAREATFRETYQRASTD